MIVYDPFWHTIKQKGISTYRLIEEHEISSATIHSLRHNANLLSATIDNLCRILDCRVEDIMLYIPDPETVDVEPETPNNP